MILAVFLCNMNDWLVFNANFRNFSAISWCEQIFINLDTYFLCNIIDIKVLYRASVDA